MNISLVDFDREYLELLEGVENVRYAQDGHFYTILCDGERAGVVGYIPSRAEEDAGFVQIIISPEFRGRGIVQEAEDLLARIHGLRTLYARTDVSNEASVRAHLRAGFTYPDKIQLEKHYS